MRQSPIHEARTAASLRASQPSWQAFFSYGFRPFFSGAAVFAVLAMVAWLAILMAYATDRTPATLPMGPIPHIWHAHEMVYGFAMAAVAGFLLTAVPNWTGARPASGTPLVVLATLWLAGRLALFASAWLPPHFVTAVDLAFTPALAVLATRQLLVKPQRRNLVFLVLLTILTLANAQYHAVANGWLAGDPLFGVRIALAVVVTMIVIIGGRIVPAFTHNYLHLHGHQGRMPVRDARLDAVSVAGGAAALLAWGLGLTGPIMAGLAIVAGIANALRLALWQGAATRDEPIVWVLHLGYAWVVVGLLLVAATAITNATPAVAATHAFGAGAAGTMILAVMSRASLGHTGRALRAAPVVVASYCLVTLSALLRVVGAHLSGSPASWALTASGVLWVAAFAAFLVHYLPILTTPRLTAERGSG